MREGGSAKRRGRENNKTGYHLPLPGSTGTIDSYFNSLTITVDQTNLGPLIFMFALTRQVNREGSGYTSNEKINNNT